MFAFFASHRGYGTAAAIFLVGASLSFVAFHLYQLEDKRHAQQEFHKLAHDRLAGIRAFLLADPQKLSWIENWLSASENTIGMRIRIEELIQGEPRSIHPFPSSTPNASVLFPEDWTYRETFKLGPRTLEATVLATPDFIGRHLAPHWDILIMGLLFSGLMAFHVLICINRQLLVEKKVRERTNELAAMNTLLQEEIHERQRIEQDFTQAQQNLKRRHEALEYFARFTSSGLQDAIHQITLRTASVMQIDRTSIWFYEMRKQTPVLSCASLYISASHSSSHYQELTATDFPLYFEALSQHSPLILPSPHNDPLNRELDSYLSPLHIRSKLDIPIVFEGHLLAILCCEETRKNREWLLEDRHFGQIIADIIAILIEQSARRKAEKALKESEERLGFIRQKSIDGIIAVNEKGSVISWNFGAEKIFGYNEQEMLGQSLALVLPENSLLLQDISTKPIELKSRHKDGHLFPVEISHSCWKNGDLYFGMVIIRDITERKENEKRLIQAMREAHAANEAKSEFLATISHELRTPLNAVIGFNQCLLMGMDGPLNEAQRISLKKIEKSSFHLLTLINDILDLAKIEAKRMELEIRPHNLVHLVVSCVEEMQPIAEQKHLTLSLELDEPSVLLEMDKFRIRQVLMNLLSNAIKFTEKGSIWVRILTETRRTSVQVEDTGIGLTTAEIKKIFHPFSQADSTITRKYGGTGLGLAISKKIMELHRGTISVESTKGVGSTFTLTLPRKEEEA